MPRRNTTPRTAMFNTPVIRTGGFGALQVEAVTDRPRSIARRHLAASQLRMRGVEPDELSSSEWVQFLVMEDPQRDRWVTGFLRRRERSQSEESSGSASAGSDDERSGSSRQATSTHPIPLDRETAYHKAEEAAAEAADAAAAEAAEAAEARRRRMESLFAPPTANGGSGGSSGGRTPAFSLWARQFDGDSDQQATRPSHYHLQHHRTISSPTNFADRQPRHMRRPVTPTSLVGVRAQTGTDAPPTYETAVRGRTPPPAYAPRRRES